MVRHLRSVPLLLFVAALFLAPDLGAADTGATMNEARPIETAQATGDAAEPAPDPAPDPEAEPPARDYLVYFDFDKADIRPDAAIVLDRVAQGVFSVGSSNVSLVGHADTSGPADYNQWLSERRAFAVREYLIGKGIAAQVIAKGRGEDELRLATGDGVEEQENRRVEIQIN